MADMCFKELAAKAKIYEQTKVIPLMESSCCAIKSDALFPNELT
ncbi:hypothetical protein FNYG_15369 [Fusarium nygamai]|uniref:DUF4246 domain-containing protein n=1 Tax=Gibberella nygamai TaxID=42673 RepID=A0A2K0UEW4_GIBNY|nr:hypothetical protein FNYG_15369 [Fusarium nygamai]